MYKQHNKQDTTGITRIFNGWEQQLYTFDSDCDQAVIYEPTETQLDNNTGNKYSAIAVIGDKFYKGKFVSYDELSKSYRSMDGSYHDFNHWGTTYTDGNPNIKYIIGYQKNTSLDPISKKMKTDVFINKEHPEYPYWHSFIETNKQAGRTPNVSVSFWASTLDMQAKALPKNSNYQQYGYSEDDMVPYLYDIQFQALSTVFQGACNDKDGCGIGIGYKKELSDKQKVLELMIEIEKEKNKQKKMGGKR